VRLNGGRIVTGVLRGFDPFMNLVIDEAVEECKTGEKNQIGMVVSLAVLVFIVSLLYYFSTPLL
jgi:small nuclear ribonucleoprotein G